MNLYEKIAAELIAAFTVIALFVAYLRDKREKRRDAAAALPPVEKCALKEDVDQAFDQVYDTFEQVEEKFKEEREAREKLGEKVNDAFVQIGENKTRIVMMLEFLKNKSF